jgi:hypothetical protein
MESDSEKCSYLHMNARARTPVLCDVSIHDVDLDESLTCEVSNLRSTNQDMTRMLEYALELVL